MSKVSEYRGSVCELILALQDGPQTVAGLTERLGTVNEWGNARGIRNWLADFERHGLVRCTRPPSRAGVKGKSPYVYEWVIGAEVAA